MGKSDNELVLLRATVTKLRGERKIMHTMLSEAGVPDDVLGDGVRTCLIGRLAIAIHMGPVLKRKPTCDCPNGRHSPFCPFWR